MVAADLHTIILTYGGLLKNHPLLGFSRKLSLDGAPLKGLQDLTSMILLPGPPL